MQLLRVISPYFVAGLILKGDQVVRCPPIIRFMLNWSLPQVSGYCANKNWMLDDISPLVQEEEGKSPDDEESPL